MSIPSAVYLAKDGGHAAPPPSGGKAYLFDANGVPITLDDAGVRGVSPYAARGLDLSGATQTINPGTDHAAMYVLPGAVASGAVLTLGVSGSPLDGQVVSVLVIANGANSYVVKDDAGTTLTTIAASTTNMLFNYAYSSSATHFAALSCIPTA